MSMNSRQILDLFVEQQIVNADSVDDIIQEINNTGKEIQDILVDYEFVTRDQFYHILATSIGAEYYDLSSFTPDTEVVRQIPAGQARLHEALPIAWNPPVLTVALVDTLNPQTVDDLRFSLNKDIQVAVAPVDQIQRLLDECYGADASSMTDILDKIGEELSFGGEDTIGGGNEEEEANAAPIIKFVDLILQQAIADRASDIHFEPFEHEFRIRYRVDGALYEMAPPPRHLAMPVISRVKVMANLNIAEKRLPQDGRIQKTIANRPVDLRVSTLPTQFGESVVLRVLDRSAVNLDLETLGMPEYIFDYITNTIRKPNGIFIVTGPTGSGKTTTLYSCLRKINTIDSKLLTAEDPVEYDIDGIIQVPIQDSIGLSFGRVLRAFLRQDPDRIMVGETRDIETAQIAIQASLTGHLVFTTLHTNDAPGAVTRLIDMGVEPFLISASLEGVLAQRLIRKICQNCKEAYEPSEGVLSQLGLSAYEIGDKQFYYGIGCDVCNKTGYKGRKGIYELLDINDPLRQLINERAPAVTMKQKAVELGMVTLREDGLRNIYDGEATIEEVLKYT